MILAHEENEKCPVIFETIPTYANLFGTIQRSYDARGGWNSDFMDLRGGSLLRADGGFLVMYALDTLTETGVWRTLKRTLNHGKLEIQPVDVFFPFSPAALKPEPIDVHVKIILIGDRRNVRASLRARGRLQKDIQSARRVRRGDEVQRRRAAAVRRAAAQALRRRKASALRSHGGGGDSGAGRARRGGGERSPRAFSIWRTWGGRHRMPRGTREARRLRRDMCARRWTRRSSATIWWKPKFAR